MDKNEIIFDELKDLTFIKITTENDQDVDLNAAFIDLEEEEEIYGLPIVYIKDVDDIILSPFTNTKDIYATYRPNVYGCLETDKEFLVVIQNQED